MNEFDSVTNVPRSPLFSGAIPPIRVGVYFMTKETLIGKNGQPWAGGYARFDGHRWVPHGTWGNYIGHPSMLWQGLAKEST